MKREVARVAGRFSAIRLLGSRARGDGDELSDTDVLVVQSTSHSFDCRFSLTAALHEVLGTAPSVSWYSEAKIRRMYAVGDLFAWHLYKESKKIFGVSSDFLDDLVPSPYRDARRDIRSFVQILKGVGGSLRAAPGNAVYEAGLIFLCTRNIAMCGSWFLPDGPFFGRRSPFQLEDRSGIIFPLGELDHMMNMQARVSGHRGLSVPLRSPSLVADMAGRLLPWGHQVQQFAEQSEELHHG